MDNQELDSYLKIQVSVDQLSAYLLFKRITDEFTCNVDHLERFVRSKGVIHGIQLEALKLISSNPLAYCKEQTLIAKGNSVEPGEDGYIKMIYNMADKDQKPAELQDGKVDFKEVKQINNVKRGQLIAQRVDAQFGKPGKSVTGQELEPKQGKQARFKVGKNVVINAEQTAIYAAIDGMVTMTDKDKFNVFPVFEVNGDVDYGVGNIDFVGTVVIRGNVLSGFRVRASGDIRVIGGVEGAELEADGSIEVTGGILAGNKGAIKAAKNVKSSFIQDANVYAGEDVLVSQSIMHSNVKAGRNVICSGAKGLIVGGIIQAGEHVIARTIGNSMSTSTTIEVGVRPDARAMLQENRQKQRVLKESIDKADKALVILDQLAASGQITQDKLELRTKFAHTKRQNKAELDDIKAKTLELEKSLENTERSKIEVSNTVYGGTKIVIGRYTKFVKDASGRVVFLLVDSEIVLSPL